MAIRTILIDDHSLIRAGLGSLLRGQADVEIVGEGDDGNAAVRLAAKLAPDVVVMDISMPGLNGLDATRQITAANPNVRVLILSAYLDQRVAAEAFDAGAMALVSKTSAFEELCQAIRTIQTGRIYISPNFAGDLTNSILNAATSAGRSFRKLSDRERSILQMVVAGKSSKEIAYELDLSVKTIDSHRRQVMEKMDVNSVAELTKAAVRLGLSSM